MIDDGRVRCEWGAIASDPEYVAYHDEDWGVPVRDGRLMYELLVLEGAQAGLSWSTILHKRTNYQRAFDGFDPELVARYGELDIARLMGDAGIVRNRAKLLAAIDDARAVVAMRDGPGPRFVDHLWSFVDGSPLVGHWTRMGEIPAETDESRAMSKDLKQRGFRFVGPTICYALMQSAGLVNDHITSCFRWSEV